MYHQIVSCSLKLSQSHALWLHKQQNSWEQRFKTTCQQIWDVKENSTVHHTATFSTSEFLFVLHQIQSNQKCSSDLWAEYVFLIQSTCAWSILGTWRWDNSQASGMKHGLPSALDVIMGHLTEQLHYSNMSVCVFHKMHQYTVIDTGSKHICLLAFK